MVTWSLWVVLVTSWLKQTWVQVQRAAWQRLMH
jgi:hypothetical protein